jgi:hypothetical protein
MEHVICYISSFLSKRNVTNKYDWNLLIIQLQMYLQSEIQTSDYSVPDIRGHKSCHPPLISALKF